MKKKAIALLIVALSFGISLFHSLPMVGHDVLNEGGRETLGYLVRIAAILALQYLPLFAVSFLGRRWWWVIAVAALPLAFMIGSTGGFDATLVILLALPFAASVLSLFSPRLSLSIGVSGERSNSDDARSYWD